MALILDGKAVAKFIQRQVADEVKQLKHAPTLSVFLCTDNPASQIYVKNKIKVCDEIGIKSKLIQVTDLSRLKDSIQQENATKDVNGILVQLPVPGINKYDVLDVIDPKKDVDCFTATNVGKLLQGRPVFNSCTPAGIVHILKYYHISTWGKKVCIINRSDVVGKPMFAELIRENVEMGNATVAMCHDRTPPSVLKETCLWADIVIVAVGKRGFLTVDLVHDKSVVIDVGINKDENGKTCGDAAPEVKEKVAAITPVPGGVGPCTVAMLMFNTVRAYMLQRQFSD